jgi:Spy/CpxP family protein refolding chaperone
MYPGFFGWRQWKAAAGHGAHGHHHCGAGGGGGGGSAWAGPPDDGEIGGAGFGVRRPLRFLAHKLELDEKQIAELAHILDDLKTERAQAAVDNRRATSAFADALSGDVFDEAKVGQASQERVKSAERVRDALSQALAKIHALLAADQRSKLAYLIRTGALSI